MSILEAIILGLVQGLTEFLPVSSSGHLVLTQELMGVEDKGVTFEILVHFATLLSVIIYFWRPLFRMVLAILPPFKPEFAKDRMRIVYLAVACVPAAFVGFSPLRNAFENAYDKPAVVALLLICTGVLLFLPRLMGEIAKRTGKSTAPKPGPEAGEGETWGNREVGFLSALAMGMGQAVAILPGISRSGSTIVSGMLAGVKSSDAAEFSFLMAIPAIAAAAVLELGDLNSIAPEVLTAYLVGAVVAFASGLAAIYTVLASIRKGKFEYFGIYCLIAGTAAFFYFRSVGV